MSTNPNKQIFFVSDESAFEHLFKTHYEPLVNFAIKYVHELETAEELVQQVFLRIWEKSENLEIQTSIRSYLFGAVRNAALNSIKRQKIEQQYVDYQVGLADGYDNTDFLELDELKTKISRAMDKIPDKCRQIFELNRFEGKRYKEIADELNLSLKTVENQMGKALKILREELVEYLPLLIFLMGVHGGKF